MKRCFLLVLVGLIAFWAAPSFADNTSAELLPTLLSDDDASAVDLSQPGPRRDPVGDDWIFYDNDQIAVYWPGGGGTYYYSRVIFTPNTTFQLQAIRGLIYNARNSAARFEMFVYREDQNNHNLSGDPVYHYHADRLPNWNQNNPHLVVELAENEYVQFEANESFSIIYGPCPGGDANQNGAGYWSVADGASDTRRSYNYFTQNADDVPSAHRSWRQESNDILLRANGTYLANFTDAGVLDVFNSDGADRSTGKFLLAPNQETTFSAHITSLGADIGAMAVVFSVKTLQDEEIFNREVIVENLAGGDTIVVDCDTTWSSADIGRYRAFVTVSPDEDTNADNNSAGLDQVVYDPVNFPEEWIGYTDGDNREAIDSDIGGDGGFAAAFVHPGGQEVYWVTGFRAFIMPNAAQNNQIGVAIGRVDYEANSIEFPFTDTVATDGTTNWQWVEVTFDIENYVTFQAGQGILPIVFSDNQFRVGVDPSVPQAGTNNFMPIVMWTVPTDLSGATPAGSGDYALEAKIMLSDAPPEGKLLTIIPDTLDFGDSLSMGEYHTIEALIIAYGSDSVTVRNIQIPPALRNYVTVGPNAFALASRDTQRVTVSFRADRQIPLNSQLLIASDWQNQTQFFWKFYASTMGGASVNENVKSGVPDQFVLSQNFPNPFNPTTTINFALPIAGDVTFAVFDINGRQVENTMQKHLGAGYHSIDFNASNLPAGVYTYKLTSGAFSSSMKMALIK